MQTVNRILNFPPLARIRRNHALEHATLQMLAAKQPGISAAGYSDTKGFYVLGHISTDQLRVAVTEGLRRLKLGETKLAIHPNCGTNFASSGVVAGTLGWLAMVGVHGSVSKRMERWPLVVLLVTIGMILAQPLGPRLQALVTVDGNVGDLEVTEITRFERQGTPMHRVRTAH